MTRRCVKKKKLRLQTLCTAVTSKKGEEKMKHLHMRGADRNARAGVRYTEETSPHAWSRPLGSRTHDDIGRNISTCVEQTAPTCKMRYGRKKHLHMRGTDAQMLKASQSLGETSPHAWSIPLEDPAHRIDRGNISTCVEQTDYPLLSRSFFGKHLHMRGADLADATCEEVVKETSPHAWSRLMLNTDGNVKYGNISTCVEQTHSCRSSECSRRKHLHMRGADSYVFVGVTIRVETSPHAWSRRLNTFRT